jgi:hypothetical protein
MQEMILFQIESLVVNIIELINWGIFAPINNHGGNNNFNKKLNYMNYGKSI